MHMQAEVSIWRFDELQLCKSVGKQQILNDNNRNKYKKTLDYFN